MNEYDKEIEAAKLALSEPLGESRPFIVLHGTRPVSFPEIEDRHDGRPIYKIQLRDKPWEVSRLTKEDAEILSTKLRILIKAEFHVGDWRSATERFIRDCEVMKRVTA